MTGSFPRLVVTQFEGCAPIVRAYREDREVPEPWGEVNAVRGGLNSSNPAGGKQVLDLIRRTKGAAIAVSNSETEEAVSLLGKEEGLLACSEGATTLAELRHALDEGIVRPDEQMVLINTGSGQRNGTELSS